MEKQRVLVVGGSKGIGQALCTELSCRYIPINLARTNNSTTYNYYLDVMDTNSIEEAFNYLKLYHSNVVGMIYCAGYATPLGLLRTSTVDIEQTLKVNLMGAITCTQKFLTTFGMSNKFLMYVASTAGTRPQPEWPVYAATKAGLINFAQSMYEMLVGYNTKVYTVSPGRCATALRQTLAPTEDPTTIMQPEELAKAIGNLLIQGNLLAGQNVVFRK